MTTSTRRPRRVLGSLALALALSVLVPGSRPSAQSNVLGTFRWQLLPYCNVVSLSITPQGAEFQVDGTDDQCGASRQAAVVGRAFPNPDGSIGLGFTIVSTPGGTPVHVDATITLPSISGTWRDSTGLSGSFVFTAGAAASGQRRPVPASGLPPAAITGASFAPGSIPVTALAPGVVSSALSAVPACDASQYFRGMSGAGRAVCQAFRGPTSVTLPYGMVWEPVAVVGSDGLPLIAHDDGTALLMTKCHDVSCQTGATSTVVAPMKPKWMAIDSGGVVTVVGVGQNASGSLIRVLRCGDSACTGGNTVQDVALSDGATPAVVVGGDGYPAITYVGRDAVRQLFCGNAACASGNVDHRVADRRGFTLVQANRLTAAGQIAAVYDTDAGNPALKRTFRVLCDRSGCNQPSERSTYPIPQDRGAIGSDGLPVGLRTPFGGSGVVEIVHCDDPDCLTSTVALADALPGNYVGDFPHLGIGTDGLPVISHKHSDLGALRVTHCGTVRCDAGNESATIDDPPFIVGHETFVLGGSDGFPLVLHRDTPTHRLRVTKCWSPTCQ